MSEELKTWLIYRNDNQIANAMSHSQVARIVKQLTKRYPHDRITVRFNGKPISHCGDGGKSL
jgi:hypothetical protein